MLDFKSFFESIKLFKKEESDKEPIKKKELSSIPWNDQIGLKNDYRACFIDGSYIEPSRHFNNPNIGFSTAVGVIIDYNDGIFLTQTKSKVIDTNSQQFHGREVNQIISNLMVEQELLVGSSEKENQSDLVFFDLSLDYLLNNKELKENKKLISILEAIFDTKSACFYTSNPSKSCLENIGLSGYKLEANSYKSWFIIKSADIITNNKPYLKTDILISTGKPQSEIALVEIVCKKNNAQELLWITFDQIRKGNGYPRGLALAHNLCTITMAENELFHHIVQEKNINSLSAKQTNKKISL